MSTTNQNNQKNEENKNKSENSTNTNLPPLRSMERSRTFVGTSGVPSLSSGNIKPLRSLTKRKKTVSFKQDTVKIIDVDCWKKYNVDVSECDQKGNWKRGKLLQQLTEEEEMDRKEKEDQEKQKKEQEKCHCSCIIF